MTLGRISYSKYVKVKRNPYSHDLHETGDKNNYFDHSKITFQRALHIRAKYFVFPPESNSIWSFHLCYNNFSSGGILIWANYVVTFNVFPPESANPSKAFCSNNYALLASKYGKSNLIWRKSTFFTLLCLQFNLIMSTDEGSLNFLGK